MSSRSEQDEFCGRVYAGLARSLALYCGRVDLAEEAAQEALARLCVHWDRVEHREAWVRRVAMNLLRSRFRRAAIERRVQARAELGVDVHEDPDAADAVAVRAALEGVSPRQRAALVWRYYADLPVRDVARIMGCAEGTVQALTAQGLSGLRKLLGEFPLEKEEQ